MKNKQFYLISLVLLILILPSILAVEITDASGILGSSTTIDAARNGFKIVSNKNVTLLTISKTSLTDCSLAYVETSAGSILDTQSFIGNNATFNFALLAGITYRITCNDGGVDYNNHYSNPTLAGNFPINRINVNYTSAVGFGEGSNIFSVTTGEVTPPVEIPPIHQVGFGEAISNTFSGFSKMFPDNESLSGLERFGIAFILIFIVVLVILILLKDNLEIGIMLSLIVSILLFIYFILIDYIGLGTGILVVAIIIILTLFKTDKSKGGNV